MKSQNFVPQNFLLKEGRITKTYLANKLFTFFKANYTHKRGVKCAVDHRVMKIYRNNGRRHSTLLFNLSLLHNYFSLYYYLYIQNFFCLSGSAGKKTFCILQPTFILNTPFFRLRFMQAMHLDLSLEMNL